jgi:outer membrane lipoprotein-sorting protein
MPAYKDRALMKFRLTLVLLSLLVAGSACASNDRRDCKEELRKLKDTLSTNYTSQNHHGYRQAKASRDNLEYKKCASQARKARERLERDRDL